MRVVKGAGVGNLQSLQILGFLGGAAGHLPQPIAAADLAARRHVAELERPRRGKGHVKAEHVAPVGHLARLAARLQQVERHVGRQLTVGPLALAAQRPAGRLTGHAD